LDRERQSFLDNVVACLQPSRSWNDPCRDSWVIGWHGLLACTTAQNGSKFAKTGRTLEGSQQVFFFYIRTRGFHANSQLSLVLSAGL
jgi:hypothetical protein